MGATLGAVVITLITVLATHPSQIDPELVTVLHEGSGITNLGRAVGAQIHAGRLFFALLDAWGLREFGDARVAVRMNLWAWAVQGVVAGAVIRAILGRRWWTWAWWALVAFNPSMLHAAFDVGPAALLGLGTWLGVAAVGLLAVATTRAERVLALVTLALLTASAAWIRKEMAVPGVLALLAGLAAVRHGADALDARAMAWLRDAWAWTLRKARHPRFPAAVVLAVVLLHLTRSIGGYQFGTTLWMAVPVAPQVVPPLFHALNYLPLGAVILAVIGTVHLGRRPFATGLVVLSLPALLRGYNAAANGVSFELFRYMTMAVPLLSVAATFGFQELRSWVRRAADGVATRGLLAAATAIALLLPPPAGQQAFLIPDFDDNPVRDFPPLLSLLQQEEVRLAIQSMEQWPDCAHVSPVTTNDHGTDRHELEWSWVVFGRHHGYRVFPAVSHTFDQVVQKVGASCVRVFLGQDCNLWDAPDACADFLTMGEVVLERRVRSGQYNAAPEFGAVTGDARLAVIDPQEPLVAVTVGAVR